MALAAEQVTVVYRHTTALDSVELTVESGELLCLLGPNGAGKSTLARSLAGLLPLQHGRTLIDGTALTNLSPRERARRIGFLPQEVRPAFSFRVDEAVALGARCAGPESDARSASPPGDHADTAVDAALRSVDALGLAERRLDELSGGERRRVLLASVLAQQPRYLILDEPTAMLDLEHQSALFRLFHQLAESGIGVLVVTHDLNLAARHADRLALLRSGRLHSVGTPDQVLRAEVLREVFGPHFTLLEHPPGPPVVVPE